MCTSIYWHPMMLVVMGAVYKSNYSNNNKQCFKKLSHRIHGGVFIEISTDSFTTRLETEQTFQYFHSIFFSSHLKLPTHDIHFNKITSFDTQGPGLIQYSAFSLHLFAVLIDAQFLDLSVNLRHTHKLSASSASAHSRDQ